MKQILQNLRTGRLNVANLPDPTLAGPGALIATQASVISAGTEKMLIDFAAKGFIAKAKSRPKDVKQVLDKIKRDGLKAAMQTVMARLDQPMPLGYSSAGIVLATSPEVKDLKPGDRVACGGAGHAEITFVPKNLIVKVPQNVDFASASFATLGSIALQGVRVAELVVGEKVAVIGLGLLGLITIQLVKAAGCRVIGTDINLCRLELAEKLGCDYTCSLDKLANAVGEFTNNIGVDKVIITAATKSNQPIEQAAQIARKKGIISVVGAVKMDLVRKPFYMKELQLRLSTSYGPGRYDSQYEEKGIDYPYAYVPWTEQRNMACIIDLISQDKLDVDSLITHKYPVEKAEEAYKLVRGETKEPYLGIVLTYPEVENRKSAPVIKSSNAKPAKLAKGAVGIGIIGAGNFANLTMLPAMKRLKDISFVGIADRNTMAAKHAQSKFGFEYSTGDHQKLLTDNNINAVFITTRHNNHAALVMEVLNAGKNVMVEKPLCLTEEQLYDIVSLAEKKPELRVMVGFNRRFAPMAIELKERFKDRGPLSINYICNAGFTPKDSWTQDPQIGGGRIIGEGCHFIDWMIWLTNSAPVKLYAQNVGKETGTTLKDDNVMISLQFEDGSIGTVSYLASGDKSFTKEHIQVFGGGCIGIINDFRKGTFTSNGNTIKMTGNSKGHFEEWHAVIEAITKANPSPIPFEELVASTWTTFKAIDSLNCGQAIDL